MTNKSEATWLSPAEADQVLADGIDWRCTDAIREAFADPENVSDTAIDRKAIKLCRCFIGDHVHAGTIQVRAHRVSDPETACVIPAEEWPALRIFVHETDGVCAKPAGRSGPATWRDLHFERAGIIALRTEWRKQIGAASGSGKPLSVARHLTVPQFLSLREVMALLRTKFSVELGYARADLDTKVRERSLWLYDSKQQGERGSSPSLYRYLPPDEWFANGILWDEEELRRAGYHPGPMQPRPQLVNVVAKTTDVLRIWQISDALAESVLCARDADNPSAINSDDPPIAIQDTDLDIYGKKYANVIAAFREQFPGAARPSVDLMINRMIREQGDNGKFNGFDRNTLVQILAGRYKPMKDRGIPGL